MKNSIIYFSLICLLMMQSCYLRRYQDMKTQYEAFAKELSKARSKNAKLKAEKQSKVDSIALFNNKSAAMKREITRADSMIEVYTNQIRAQLGDDIWGDSVEQAANTGSATAWMSKEEKDVLYWLNLARLQPDLYAELYIEPYLELYENQDWQSDAPYPYSFEMSVVYINTCYLSMANMDAKQAMVPDKECHLSAECHAIESGKTGYIGHDRTNCTEHFSAECCEYGSYTGFDVILNLLLDTGVPSLGHRVTCLGHYQSIGISVQPHLSYGVNTVMDFD
jgi:hypothetical protein